MNKFKLIAAGILLITAAVFTSCAAQGGQVTSSGQDYDDAVDYDEAGLQTTVSESPTPAASPSEAKGSRDNTPKVLAPTSPGTEEYGNDVASIDASNSAEGYVTARYFGSNNKVKLMITGPDGNTYRYDLNTKEYTAFPLTAGNGTYSLGIYENISGDSYTTAMKVDINVTLNDEFRPYLYPSQYVAFDENCLIVEKAQELAFPADNDLDVVSNIYNYVIKNISYDHDKAAAPPTGYISSVDDTLESGKGICLDYAAVMTGMLRSQGIPTRLEVGYAKEAYHAWISTYIKDIGWVNGMIEFDGKSWKLMDPTFAANSTEKSLKKFIGNGSNYTVKYEY